MDMTGSYRSYPILVSFLGWTIPHKWGDFQLPRFMTGDILEVEFTSKKRGLESKHHSFR